MVLLASSGTDAPRGWEKVSQSEAWVTVAWGRELQAVLAAPSCLPQLITTDYICITFHHVIN